MGREPLQEDRTEMVVLVRKDKDDGHLLRGLPIEGEMNIIEDMMNPVEVLEKILTIDLDARDLK